MLPNCSGEVRRPCARTEYVNFWFFGAGLPPIWPAGLTVFCDWIALTISANRDAQLRKMVRLDPEPHRILGCPENLRVSDAGQAPDGIVQVDVGVVGQKLGVPGALRGIQADKHEWRGCGFLHRYAVVIYIGGKLRSGLGLARLR